LASLIFKRSGFLKELLVGVLNPKYPETVTSDSHALMGYNIQYVTISRWGIMSGTLVLKFRIDSNQIIP
jgi:hypothetical protein